MPVRVPNYLLDTSCVLAAFHPAFPELRRQIEKHVANGVIWSTWYLRMEFYRRWILTWIETYFTAKHFGDLSQAFGWMKESYGMRYV